MSHFVITVAFCNKGAYPIFINACFVIKCYNKPNMKSQPLLTTNH